MAEKAENPNNYILEVSWGVPSSRYPTNGLFQFDQAKALKQIGEQIVFLGLDMRSVRRWRRWGLNSFDKEGIPAYEYNFPYGPAVKRDLKYRIQKKCFERAMRTISCVHGKPRCIHVHTCLNATAIVDYCQNNNIPFVITEHLWPVDYDEAVKLRMKEAYEQAGAIITVSNALGDVLHTQYGVSTVTVHNIVDLTDFHYGPPDEPETPMTSNREFRFISAADVTHRKGFDILVRAYAQVLKKYPDTHLTIMGDGAKLGEIKELSDGLNISDNITYTGRYVRSQFASELAGSDCFVLASRDETFGIVFVEAMACGVPVITTRCGGPEDFIDATNGILVPIGDSEALAQAMITIIERPQYYDRGRMAAACAERFSAERIAKQILEVINMLAD